MHLVAIVVALPALNAHKGALGTRPIARDSVARLLDLAERVALCIRYRHQIFRAREHEHVVLGIRRQAFLGLARDTWDGELPAQPKGPIPIARTVLQRQLWPKAIAAGRGRDGN